MTVELSRDASCQLLIQAYDLDSSILYQVCSRFDQKKKWMGRLNRLHFDLSSDFYTTSMFLLPPSTALKTPKSWHL